jgi:hypothetical protein
MNRYSLLVALSLLAGCATAPPPPLTADDPASPSAPEATVRPRRNALGVDNLTKKSRQIFAQAAKQQQQWDQSGPVSGGQQGQQMQNMPRHANAPAAGVPDSDAATAPSGSNAWHEDAPGIIPTITNSQ